MSGDEQEPRVFSWPCGLREAHGQHPIPGGWGECPGVKAHPATMIGGAYDEW